MKDKKDNNQAAASLRPKEYACGDLRTLIAALQNTPHVWNQRPVESEPVKRIAAWSVYKATPSENERSSSFGLHFVGRDLCRWSGCVSSKIASFDTKGLRGTTQSGRIYQLYGSPGHYQEADYVLGWWTCFNELTVEDVTMEFLESHGLPVIWTGN